MKIKVKIEKNVGNDLIKFIENSKKKVLIVSPWLSISYVKKLLDLKKKKVEVKILTSDSKIEKHLDCLKLLIGKNKVILRKRRIGLISLGIFFLLISTIIFNLLSIFLILIGIFLILKGREIKKMEYFSKIDNLKIFSSSYVHPLHAKIYLIDDYIIIGSPNLTEMGMEKSIESFAIFKSNEISKEIENMIDKVEEIGKIVSIEEIGKKLKI